MKFHIQNPLKKKKTGETEATPRAVKGKRVFIPREKAFKKPTFLTLKKVD